MVELRSVSTNRSHPTIWNNLALERATSLRQVVAELVRVHNRLLLICQLEGLLLAQTTAIESVGSVDCRVATSTAALPRLGLQDP